MTSTLPPRVAAVGLLIAITPLFLAAIFFPAMHGIISLFAPKEHVPAYVRAEPDTGVAVASIFFGFLPAIVVAAVFTVYMLRRIDSWFNSLLSFWRSSRQRTLWYLGAAFSISVFSWVFLVFAVGPGSVGYAKYLAASVIIQALLFLYLFGRRSLPALALAALYVFLLESLLIHLARAEYVFAPPGTPAPLAYFLNAYGLWIIFALSFAPFFDRKYFDRESPVFKSIARALLLAGAALVLMHIPLVAVAAFGFWAAYLAILAALFFQTLALAWIVVESGQS